MKYFMLIMAVAINAVSSDGTCTYNNSHITNTQCVTSTLNNCNVRDSQLDTTTCTNSQYDGIYITASTTTNTQACRGVPLLGKGLPPCPPFYPFLGDL
ncbi:hypothetical protein MSG28_010636 [Choristoneura fumiferana]|uniref:Uncharacterized protein n=1 Tax=Choristoneura fumiferana TaxID=7141 RepID=A0ACC0KNX7_CHOFU|nr:hypothetical protein MSG28_010636 [Choristoneura fumiferana]